MNLELITYEFTSQFLKLSPVHQLRTVHESFKSLSVITTKNKTDNRIDSTVPDTHIVGDNIVWPKTTGKMSGTGRCIPSD